MFLEFYKLKEQPFGVTPDPRYLFLGSAHREAMASLLYGIETDRGFVSLIGQPGMGKTTLLFQLLQRWKGCVNSAFLFQTQCDSKELIRYLLHDLGLCCETDDIVRMHSELNQFLLREALAGRRTIVFIDEAQNLSDSVLETVRLLSDFEATDQKLLQIVLAGQPELAERLSRPGMAQLRQRLSVQAHLKPLPGGEVVAYVNRRLTVAGYEGGGLFTPGALSMLAECSGGIPRVINNVCFHALSLGYAKGAEKITSDIVHEVAQDLSLHAPASRDAGSGSRPARGPVPERARRQGDSSSPVMNRMFSWRAAGAGLATAVLAMAAMYFGKPQQAALLSHARLRKPPVSGNAVASMDRVFSASSGEPLEGSFRPVSVESSTPSFVYVVQPNDTIHDLCVWATGRYDDALVAEIRKLNPGLRDLDHLQVGQRIRFPLSFRNSSAADLPATQQR